jgi:predicted acyltransferase
MAFISVPGFGPANFNPGTNLGAWLDRTLLTEAHLYKQSKTWDPEGILSTVPAVATGIFGMLIGTWLKRKDKEETVKVAWMFSIGILAVCLGLIFDAIFPINKSLWTSSYVLYAGGLATLGLALFYWLIDIQGYRKFTKPFVVYGVNAITVFFLSGFIVRLMNLIKIDNHGKPVGLKEFLYQLLFVPYFSPVNASLAGAITFVLIWLGILWWMYNKNIIVKV